LAQLNAGAGRNIEDLCDGAVVCAHRCLSREANELGGQRKFKASQHLQTIAQRGAGVVDLKQSGVGWDREVMVNFEHLLC